MTRCFGDSFQPLQCIGFISWLVSSLRWSIREAIFKYKAQDAAYDDDERLGWNHALVWIQPLQTGRQADTHHAADCRARGYEDVYEAHGWA